MKVYQNLVERILKEGVRKTNRTGVDTLSSFSEFYKIDLEDGFPLLTTKRVPFRSVILELLWYLRGEDHIRWLRDENDCHIWDAWADKEGYVGPIYPVLWRRFPYHVKIEKTKNDGNETVYVEKQQDQIRHAIREIENNPNSRRIVISAWHPGLIDEMALPPCHLLFILNVSNGRLNGHLTQRSGDVALGIPFNLACYSALIMAIAKLTNLKPGYFAHTIVDAHIYVNHIDGLKLQLKRTPKKLPELKINKRDIDDLSMEDFILTGYEPHPKIPFEVAV